MKASIRVLILLLVCGLASTANAEIILSVEDGDGNTVTDSSPFNDVASILLLGWNGFQFIQATAVGEDTLPDEGQSDLIGFETRSSGASLLTMLFVQTNMHTAGAPFFAGFQFSIGGTSVGLPAPTVDVSFFADDGNSSNVADMTLLGEAVGLGGGSGGAFAFNGGAAEFVQSPFSIAIMVTISQPGGGFASFDAHLVPTPEPGTFALVLLGAAGFVVSRRRRR